MFDDFDVNINFNSLISEITVFFQFITNIVINYTDKNDKSHTVTFFDLFVGMSVVYALLSLFFKCVFPGSSTGISDTFDYGDDDD